jgi:branched-chain amino acid transport system ATP-binding protein
VITNERTRGPLLEVRGLSAGYQGQAVVHDIDLTVHAGEIVLLLGANGAGKSTSLLAIAGHLSMLSGEVAYLGSALGGPLHQRARAGLALVPQDRIVSPGLTVEENLRLGIGPPERAFELFPELKPHAHRRAGLLSGGQQQMLTVGRALAARPRALLADEVSIGLAPKLIERIYSVVRRVTDEDGVGVLLVEQRLQAALTVGDRAYVLRLGRVVLSGSCLELTERRSELQRLYLQ